MKKALARNSRCAVSRSAESPPKVESVRKTLKYKVSPPGTPNSYQDTVTASATPSRHALSEVGQKSRHPHKMIPTVAAHAVLHNLLTPGRDEQACLCPRLIANFFLFHFIHFLHEKASLLFCLIKNKNTKSI